MVGAFHTRQRHGASSRWERKCATCSTAVSTSRRNSPTIRRPAAAWHPPESKTTGNSYLMATISEARAIALQHHQAGRLETAEQIYRQILMPEPNQPDALHLLGVVTHRLGNHAAAIEYISRAVSLKATEPAFHNN